MTTQFDSGNTRLPNINSRLNTSNLIRLLCGLACLSIISSAAFAQPALGTLGNVGAGSIAGPGTWQFDVAISRSFRIREGQSLDFRAEAFNVTNSFLMNDPVTNLNSNTFGQVLSAKDPRIMQFALKYVF